MKTAAQAADGDEADVEPEKEVVNPDDVTHFQIRTQYKPDDLALEIHRVYQPNAQALAED